MKKKRWISLAVVLLIVPFIISALMDKWPFYQMYGSDSDWFAFWGAYLGAIITVVGTWGVASWQIKEEKKSNAILNQKQIKADINNELDDKVKRIEIYLKNANNRKENYLLMYIEVYGASFREKLVDLLRAFPDNKKYQLIIYSFLNSKSMMCQVCPGIVDSEVDQETLDYKYKERMEKLRVNLLDVMVVLRNEERVPLPEDY